jgi:hypothetical protein
MTKRSPRGGLLGWLDVDAGQPIWSEQVARERLVRCFLGQRAQAWDIQRLQHGFQCEPAPVRVWLLTPNNRPGLGTPLGLRAHGSNHPSAAI